MKITEYVILSGTDNANLGYQVMSYISAGWQPYGSIKTCVYNGSTVNIMQPMVKYSE